MEDVVVVGGGIVGMAVAAELGRRGHGVWVLERSAAAVATGSSKGTARFRQLADHPDESFLDLGIRAREIWGEVEAVADDRIFRRTGNLSIGTVADLTALAQGLRSRDLPVRRWREATCPDDGHTCERKRTTCCSSPTARSSRPTWRIGRWSRSRRRAVSRSSAA